MSVFRIIGWLPFFYIAGLISVLANGRSQGLGERVARTAIIKNKDVGIIG
jgi:uncharacterized RDD family membrane protein YckC